MDRGLNCGKAERPLSLEIKFTDTGAGNKCPVLLELSKLFSLFNPSCWYSSPASAKPSCEDSLIYTGSHGPESHPLDERWTSGGKGRCLQGATLYKYSCLSDQYPEVGPNWSHLKFKGRGQRDTLVADAKGIVEIIMLLQGHNAARTGRQAAQINGQIPRRGPFSRRRSLRPPQSTGRACRRSTQRPSPHLRRGRGGRRPPDICDSGQGVHRRPRRGGPRYNRTGDAAYRSAAGSP